MDSESVNCKCASSCTFSTNSSPTGFIKTLMEGKLSYSAEFSFWRRYVGKKFFRLFITELCKLFVHVWSKKEVLALFNSFIKCRNVFDKEQSTVLYNLFLPFRNKHLDRTQKHGGFNRKIKNLEAQSLFSVDHNIKFSGSINSLVDSFSHLFEIGTFNKMRNTLARFVLLIFELISKSPLSSKIRMATSFLIDFDWSHCIYMMNDYASALAQVLERLAGQVRNAGKKFFKIDGHRIEAQSDVPLKCETLLGGTIRLFASMLFVSDFSGTVLNTKRVKRLEELAKTVTSTEKIFKFIYHLFQDSFDSIAEKFGIVNPQSSVLAKINTEIPAWMESVSRVTSEGNIGAIARDYNLAMEVVELKKKGDTYLIDLQKSKVAPATVSYFVGFHNEIKKMAAEAAPHYFNDKMRESPFVIHLHGNSGIGKSTVQNFLIKELMYLMDLRFDPTREIYVRNSAQDHWDGYAHQPVVILDDFLQMRDTNITDEELSSLMHMKNTTAFPLKMAELHNKGTTRFTSKLVLLSSNEDLGADLRQNVKCPEAIKRRRDVVAQVVIRKDVADTKGRLDISKLPNPLCRFDTTIYGFRVDGISGVLNYAAFVKHCTTTWQRINQADRLLIDSLPVYTVSNTEPELLSFADFDCANRIMAQWSVPNCLNLCKRRNVLTIDTEESVIDDSLLQYYLSMKAEANDSWPQLVKDKYNTLLEQANSRMKRCTSQILQYQQGIKKWYEDIGSQYPWYKVGISFIGALGSITTMCTLYSYMSSTEESVEEKEEDTWIPEAGVSGDQRTTKYVQRYKMGVKSTVRSESSVPTAHMKLKMKARRQKKMESEGKIDRELYDGRMWSKNISFEAQGSSDPQAHAIIANCIYNNLGKIKIHNISLNGFFICDSIFIMPYHMTLAFKYSDQINITTRIHSHDVLLHECERVDDPENDITFLRLPQRVGSYISLLKHFHVLSDLERIRLDLAVLCTTRDVKDSAAMFIMMCNKLSPRGKIDYCARDLENVKHEIKLVKGYKYESQTQKGDCGSPVVVLHPGMQKKLLGFHVAGGDNIGICNVLTQDYISEKLLLFPQVIHHDVPLLNPDRITISAHCALSTDDKIEVLGLVDKHLQVRLPDETELRPSMLHGVFPVRTAPAVLKSVNGKNPVRIGIIPQFCENIIFPQNLVDLAVQDLSMSILSQHSSYSGMGPLDENATINGMVGDAYIRPLNFKTSPGFPYVHFSRNKPGKFSFFEGPEGSFTYGQYLRNAINLRDEQGKQGVIPFSLFVDTLKDERRPFDKVDACKTRIFNTAPLDFTCLVRKYFLPFIAHIESNHIFGECSVGINPHSDNWTFMFNDLDDAGDNWIAGDFSKYDKTLSFQLIMGVLKIIDKFYDGKDSFIRKSLFYTMFNASHLTGCAVYRVHQGNPSGVPITAIINSLVNSLLSRITFLMLAKRNNADMGMQDFHKYIRVKNYGDDNIGKVSNQCPWYNMVTISGVLEEFGIKYTPPTKGDITSEYIALEDVSYLKRGFVARGPRVWAPLDKSVIEETLSWCRGKECDVSLNIRMVFENCMREMVHYGESQFNMFQDHVHSYAASKYVFLATYDFHQLLHDFTDGLLCDRFSSLNPIDD